METEAFARALHQALLAEGASVVVLEDDLSRVRVDGELDLRALAARMAARPSARARRVSPLDLPPPWLRAYP